MEKVRDIACNRKGTEVSSPSNTFCSCPNCRPAKFALAVCSQLVVASPPYQRSHQQHRMPCQTAAPKATGNTLNCRRKSGLIPRRAIHGVWDSGMASPCPVAFTQAHGRLYRTGDMGKWTAGQLEVS